MVSLYLISHFEFHSNLLNVHVQPFHFVRPCFCSNLIINFAKLRSPIVFSSSNLILVQHLLYTVFFYFIVQTLRTIFVDHSYVPSSCMAVFLKCRAAVQYQALASIILGRERPEETTVCYKISLVQMITNLKCNFIFVNMPHCIYKCTNPLHDYAIINY